MGRGREGKDKWMGYRRELGEAWVTGAVGQGNGEGQMVGWGMGYC